MNSNDDLYRFFGLRSGLRLLIKLIYRIRFQMLKRVRTDTKFIIHIKVLYNLKQALRG